MVDAGQKFACCTNGTIKIQWNLSITALRIKDTSITRTANYGYKQQLIEMYAYSTPRIKTTSVLCNMDTCSTPKLVLNAVIEPRYVDKTTPPGTVGQMVMIRRWL